MRHLGRKQTIVLDSESSTLDDIAKAPFPRAVILAHQYAEMLELGKFSSVIELAQHLKSDRSNVARTLSLVNLAPDIVTAIMTGKAPETLALTKLIYGFPESWQEQQEAFGMA